MAKQLEETILAEDVQWTLNAAIEKYYDINEEYQSLGATTELYNKSIKDLFDEHGISKYTTPNGLKCSVSTTTKPVFNEEKLIDYIKSTGVEGIIKTKEYVDMEALENALYHGTIKGADLQPFKEDKITKTLRCSKPKQLNEG